MRKKNNKNRLLFLATSLLTIAVLASAIKFISTEKVDYEPEEDCPVQRQIRFAYRLRNETNELQKGIIFQTRAPLPNTSWQHCINIQASLPFCIEEDDTKNRVLEFRLDPIPPYSATIVRIRADLMMLKKSNSIRNSTEGNPANFTGAEQRIESDNTAIIQLAAELKSENTRGTIAAIFDWITRNLKYEGYVRKNRGALYAFKHRRGDCTEFASLFAALCRANHIPAKVVGGYICSADAILHPADYHNWVEYYDGWQWHIVDPQKGELKPDCSKYVAFKIFGSGNRLMDFGRFRVHGEGITAVMM